MQIILTAGARHLRVKLIKWLLLEIVMLHQHQSLSNTAILQDLQPCVETNSFEVPEKVHLFCFCLAFEAFLLLIVDHLEARLSISIGMSLRQYLFLVHGVAVLYPHLSEPLSYCHHQVLGY